MKDLYRRVICSQELPQISKWYGTDKGLLYYFADEKEWSCREDRISEEYPTVWYEEISLDITVNAKL